MTTPKMDPILRESRLKFDVRNNPELSRKIQEVLLAEGYGWGNSRDSRIHNSHQNFLYVNHYKVITFGNDLDYFENHEHKLTTYKELIRPPEKSNSLVDKWLEVAAQEEALHPETTINNEGLQKASSGNRLSLNLKINKAKILILNTGGNRIDLTENQAIAAAKWILKMYGKDDDGL